MPSHGSTNIFFKGMRLCKVMKVGSRSTPFFVIASIALYIYDRGILSIIAVLLALVILLLDIEEE